MLTAIAVDWSGAAGRAAQRRKIWLAEARDERILRLECGRDRGEIVRHLIERARDPLVAGLDFAFSFPEWFLAQRGVASAPELWDLVAAEGESWLRACDPPFWGRTAKCKPRFDERTTPFRRTEEGSQPKSVFQIGGAGAVGTGSLRGMPRLAELRAAGFAIWPFDAPRPPMAIEIYPRYLTGKVTKKRRFHRERYLAQRCPEQAPSVIEAAAASEDAFDAAVSALEMSRCASQLLRLARERDVAYRLEGRIWRPVDDPSTARERTRSTRPPRESW